MSHHLRLLLRAGWLLAALALPLAGHAKEAAPLADDPVVEQRMIAISEDLRCLVCQNESLAGSHAELAEALRDEIRTQIRAGKSDKEITEYLVDRYGDFVLYRPPFKATTALLWLGPLVLALIGLGALARILRRRSREVPPTNLSATEARQADALLASLDRPASAAAQPSAADSRAAHDPSAKSAS